jgi:hypothetical protein
MGTNGRQRVTESFTADRVAADIVHAYDQLLANSS